MSFLEKFFAHKKTHNKIGDHVSEPYSSPAQPERPMVNGVNGVDGHQLAGLSPEQMLPLEMPDFRATVGEPLPKGAEIADEETVIDAMRTVYDPEIPVNIYDLGLVYDFHILPETGNVEVNMSLTAPGCPVAGEMPGMLANAIAEAEGVGQVTVRLVWDPPWTMERMSEDARFALGFL